MQGGDNSLLPVKRPTDGRAHAQDLISACHVTDHRIDVCQVFFQIGRGGFSCTLQDIPLVICRGDHDLCPSDVEANKHCHSHISFLAVRGITNATRIDFFSPRLRTTARFRSGSASNYWPTPTLPHKWTAIPIPANIATFAARALSANCADGA